PLGKIKQMVALDVFGVSEKASRIVYDLRDKGYQTALEFRPKVDWPKEDEPLKEDRYIFACTVTPTKPGSPDRWIVEVAQCPNEAIQNTLRKLGIK
ncbi:MAG: hypothetical protein KY428_05980, partial [Bacteroidetes bacterium]|nr:hypothetical protein [Bacteroidota bacterium]